MDKNVGTPTRQECPMVPDQSMSCNYDCAWFIPGSGCAMVVAAMALRDLADTGKTANTGKRVQVPVVDYSREYALD